LQVPSQYETDKNLPKKMPTRLGRQASWRPFEEENRRLSFGYSKLIIRFIFVGLFGLLVGVYFLISAAWTPMTSKVFFGFTAGQNAE
jgi:hypothetical protein